MFGMTSLQELVILMLVIAVLSVSGLWPRIVRGLRELRGDAVPPDTGPCPNGAEDLDLCYRLLGLAPSATWQEVEKAFRKKAQVHHPDRGGDEDAMRTLNEAYTRIKQRHLTRP